MISMVGVEGTLFIPVPVPLSGQVFLLLVAVVAILFTGGRMPMTSEVVMAQILSSGKVGMMLSPVETAGIPSMAEMVMTTSRDRSRVTRSMVMRVMTQLVVERKTIH